MLIDLQKKFSIGPQWSNIYDVTLNLTQPYLPYVVMPYHDHSHPINTMTSITSNLNQILLDLHEIFILCPQGSNRYEVTLNLTQPHKPEVVLTYHEHSSTTKTTTYKHSYVGQIFIDLKNDSAKVQKVQIPSSCELI